MDRAKPFCIAKRDVWEAYRQVKANRGEAGVDEQSLTDFDRDLSKNLYRIWNRMCSGSYFPPPVKRVDIPKGDSGGTRPLGIPTVSDRIAQMVVKRSWSRSWNLCSTGIPMDIVRENRRTMHWPWPDAVVGITIGCSIWTSRAFSTRSTGAS